MNKMRHISHPKVKCTVTFAIPLEPYAIGVIHRLLGEPDVLQHPPAHLLLIIWKLNELGQMLGFICHVDWVVGPLDRTRKPAHGLE